MTSARTAPPTPDDLFALDGLLTDDERDIRATVRRGARRARTPAHRRLVSSAASCRPATWPRLFGDLGLLGMHLEGYGCAGTSADGVRPGLPRARGRRLRHPLAGVGAGLAGDVRDLALRHRGAEAAVAAADGRGRGDRLLRPDRARLRLRPGRRCAPAPARDGDDWVLDGTKMWITNGSVADVAVVWAQTDDGDPRLRRPDGHAGLLRAARSSTSCRCAPRSPASWCSTASGCRPTRCCPRLTGLRGPLSLPERGALRDRLGRDGRGPRLPRDGARRTPATRMQFDRPIAGFQLTQAKLADMALELHKGSCSPCTSAGSRTPAPAARPSRSASASSTTCARRSRSPHVPHDPRRVNGITAGVPGACGTRTTWSRC